MRSAEAGTPTGPRSSSHDDEDASLQRLGRLRLPVVPLESICGAVVVTEAADFAGLEMQLVRPQPEGIIEFFNVDTDVGASELAVAVAG